MLDVTETWDAFHRVVAALWREFGGLLAEPAADESPGFDELVDQLEVDLFLPACARLLHDARGEQADPDDIPARIRIVSADTGAPLDGAAGRYHSHAFHPEAPGGDVPNAVLAAHLMPIPRVGIRLVLGPTPPRRGQARRGALPVR